MLRHSYVNAWDKKAVHKINSTFYLKGMSWFVWYILIIISNNLEKIDSINFFIRTKFSESKIAHYFPEQMSNTINFPIACENFVNWTHQFCSFFSLFLHCFISACVILAFFPHLLSNASLKKVQEKEYCRRKHKKFTWHLHTTIFVIMQN